VNAGWLTFPTRHCSFRASCRRAIAASAETQVCGICCRASRRAWQQTRTAGSPSKPLKGWHLP
jgi:hypothetical protein